MNKKCSRHAVVELFGVTKTCFYNISCIGRSAFERNHSPGYQNAEHYDYTTGQVKVLDFGLAKVKQQESSGPGSKLHTQTQSGMVMGTQDYMSPEQARGQVLDPRTDIFSVGVVLYFAATARLPFSGNNFGEVLSSIMNAQPEAMARFNYNLPPEMERIIRKCLGKERESRYQSMSDLHVDLRNLKEIWTPLYKISPGVKLWRRNSLTDIGE